MFSNFDLLFLFILDFLVSHDMFLNFFLLLLLLLNLFKSSGVFRNFFILVLLLLNLQENLSVLGDFNIISNGLFLLCKFLYFLLLNFLLILGIFLLLSSRFCIKLVISSLLFCVNSFLGLFVACSLESGDLIDISSFLSRFKCFFSLNLFS